MDNQVIYDRQRELIGEAPISTVHIIGCGGVGTWAAIMLAMAGVKSLHLYDDDVLEESNLNRLPYALGDLGKDKIWLLERAIHSIRPSCELSLHGRFQPLLHKFDHYCPVICAVDTMRDRQSIYQRCQEDGALYIDVGAESHTCTISDSPADWSIVEDRAGYFTPVWVGPVVMAAALAVNRAIHNNPGTLLAELATENIRRTDVAQEQETRGQMVGEPRVQLVAGGTIAHPELQPLRIRSDNNPQARRRRPVHVRTGQ